MPESSLLKLLRKRRSIRKFTDQLVSREQVDALVEAAVRAPTSRGLNPWEFIVVDDRATIEALGQAKAHGSNFLSNAPLAIVVVADTTRSDVWTEDCSIAAIIIQLVAEELGLGSCWAQIRNRPHNEEISADAYIKKLLSLPDQFAVECVVGVGHPDEKKEGHSKESLPYSQVHKNRF